MKNIYKLAIVGGHGLVATTLLKLLCNSFFKDSFITVYGSGENLEPIFVNERSFNIVKLCEENIEFHDVVFMCTSNEISKIYSPKFIEKGSKIIDNASYFRNDKNVPLVIAEVNPYDLLNDSNIYCNPNCVVIMLALALKPIHDVYYLEKAVISTYQSVSGFGISGLNQLNKEELGLDTNKVLPSLSAVKKQIYDNILPIVDEIDLVTGITKEEEKITNELKKILHLSNVDILSTCVRVPTRCGHGASLYLTFKDKIDIKLIEKLLIETNYVTYYGDFDYPSLLDVKGINNIAVGRLRKDFDCDYSILMFVTSDNLLRGAALNSFNIFMKLREFNII